MHPFQRDHSPMNLCIANTDEDATAKQEIVRTANKHLRRCQCEK